MGDGELGKWRMEISESGGWNVGKVGNGALAKYGKEH